mmetsp:Transcript_23388/g.34790  ORF Transcript_23388/g.34790 Transcript_23388/m.34790 type:complete len:354 (+) Transcript_23388:99-1160(+)
MTITQNEAEASPGAPGAAVSASASEKKYKMVALDLDGTLLNSNHDISDTSIAHLRYLHSRGFIVCIATGRSAFATSQIIYKLDLDYSYSSASSDRNISSDSSSNSINGFPLVCTNGAKGLCIEKNLDANHDNVNDNTATTNPITDGRQRSTQLFHNPVPLELTIKTLALAKSIGCVTNYYLNHDVYAQPTLDWHYEAIQRYANLTGVKFTYCKDDYSTAIQKGLSSKLLILCKTEDIDSVYSQVSKELGDVAKVIRGSPPFFVEILHKDVCKGNGLEKMCDTLGVDLGECISFGDGHNDIEFIQMSGLGIAMKNAVDSLKGVADDITEYSNNDDGVVRMLQQLEKSGKLHFQK